MNFIKQMPMLYSYNLSSNNISSQFSQKTVYGVRYAGYIDFASNKIGTVRTETFDNTKEITYLNFSNNYLRNIETETFDKCQSLMTFDVTENCMSENYDPEIDDYADIFITPQDEGKCTY